VIDRIALCLKLYEGLFRALRIAWGMKYSNRTRTNRYIYLVTLVVSYYLLAVNRSIRFLPIAVTTIRFSQILDRADREFFRVAVIARSVIHTSAILIHQLPSLGALMLL
jgi:hypothetical protein